MAEPEVTADAATDQLQFLETIAQGFGRAGERAGIVERTLAVAGHTVRLHFAGTGMIAPVLRAMAHLEVAGGRPELTVNVFDSATTAAPLPYLAECCVELLRTQWWEHLGGRREVPRMNGARIRTAYHLGPGILSVLDTSRNEAYYWIDDAARMPYYERGYPLTSILNWWLAGRGRYIVHAASIGIGGRCVLLTGKGGSGKSTTTVSSVFAGLQILGDDYAAVDTDRCQAHSLYNTVKLKQLRDVQRFPGLAERVDNLERVSDDETDETAERAMAFLHEHFPDQLVHSAPIEAVLVPRISATRETRIVPASQALAFKALAPSTVFQLAGNGHESFRQLGRIVRAVPAYEIQLGSHLPGVPAAIRSLLEGS
jgi:hypothetical protein